MTRRCLQTTLVTAIGLGLALTGCSSGPEHPYYSSNPAAAVIVARSASPAPPAPREESPGPAPAAGFMWIDGYWSSDNGHYEWTPGRWEAPRSGSR
ncbi:MAG: hypothetical protein ACHQAR_01020 [Steroidobacterales bacterium]